jgi:hypothetical protein
MHIPYDHKVQIFQDSVIVATTGAIGLAQRLHKHIEAAVAGHVFKNLDVLDCGKNITRRFLPDVAETHVQNHPQDGLRFGGLIAAGNPKSGPFLIFAPSGQSIHRARPSGSCFPPLSSKSERSAKRFGFATSCARSD